jgi:3-oxoacyl-[acyl-carrier protein] reductase
VDLDLGGKVAFVGGSTRGIGLAIARAFAREGASVVLTGRNADALEHARIACERENSRSQVLALQADLTDKTQIEHSLRDSVRVLGKLDAVVPNVGSGTAKAGWALEPADWAEGLNVNLLSGAALASAAMPYLLNREGCSVTFVASIAGVESIGAPVTYEAAKAALLSTMKALSRLLGPHAVRVNAVAPGNVFFPGGTWERKVAERPEHFDAYIRREVPLQRFGRPEEIADAVVFLASVRAAFITGACLTVDGGQTHAY